MKFFSVIGNSLTHKELAKYRKNFYSGTQFKSESCDSKFSIWSKLVELRIPVIPKAFAGKNLIDASHRLPQQELSQELDLLVSQLEDLTLEQFGGARNPLLLTVGGDYIGKVRYVGVCPNSLGALIKIFGVAEAYELYIEFLESFASLVLGCSNFEFSKSFSLTYKESESEFIRMTEEYRKNISKKVGQPFPEDPSQALLAALVQLARRANQFLSKEIGIEPEYKGALQKCYSHGKVTTRHPYHGKRYELYGSYARLQKEDLSLETNLKRRFPDIYSKVVTFLPKIERAFKGVTEGHFIIDKKRRFAFTDFNSTETSTQAAVLSLLELNRAGVISDQEAVMKFRPSDLELLLHPTLDPNSKKKLKNLGVTGITAAPGAAVGHVFFRLQDAFSFYKNSVAKDTDSRVILISDEIIISDSMHLGILSGLVTHRGGIASHSAVMARAAGIPCIVGFPEIKIDPSKKYCHINGHRIPSGSRITLNAAATGELFIGEGQLIYPQGKENLLSTISELLSRVSKRAKVPLEIKVNINNSSDAELGKTFGAEGIGLCRTENMLMTPEAIAEIRNVVLFPHSRNWQKSIETLEEMQYRDFKKIFRFGNGNEINIRLMDLPLYDLAQHNPKFGLRGCRFGLIQPEIYNLQIRALARAFYDSPAKYRPVRLGVLFPLVATEAELVELKSRAIQIVKDVRAKLKTPEVKLSLRIGAMIELPAAALCADKLSKIADFLVFGTNDLTQTTMGFSRDDSSHYLSYYLEKGLFEKDPFKVLSESVREIIEIALQRIRQAASRVDLGLCGEHGGDSGTLAFCLQNGINYVSCSPYRILPTRLSLLQVVLSTQKHASLRATQTPSTLYIDESDPFQERLQAG